MTTEITTDKNFDEADFRETADVLTEVFRFGYFSIVKSASLFQAVGTYASVSLGKDFDEVAERQFDEIVGFYHTHPPGAHYMSPIDARTAEAFAFTYGKRILMVIETDSGWYQAWYVDGDGITANVKVFKLPFLHGYFVVGAI